MHKCGNTTVPVRRTRMAKRQRVAEIVFRRSRRNGHNSLGTLTAPKPIESSISWNLVNPMPFGQGVEDGTKSKNRSAMGRIDAYAFPERGLTCSWPTAEGMSVIL